MRSALVVLVLAFGLGGLVPTAAEAQQPTPSVVEVHLRDGSRLFGGIISETESQIVLRTVVGVDITLTRAQIRAINPTAGTVVGGEFWTDDAVSSRLFLSGTGRALRRGEVYFAIDSLFLPVFQVGVTDRFSIGAGLPFYGAARTAWITPKFQIYRDDRTAVSAGVLHLFVPDFGVGGYAYVVATRGTPNAAVTFGGGVLYGRDEDDNVQPAIPVFTVGGEKRLGRRTKVVTENYIFQEGVVAAVGVRVIGQRISTEVGGLGFIGDGNAQPGFFFNVVLHSRPRGR